MPSALRGAPLRIQSAVRPPLAGFAGRRSTRPPWRRRSRPSRGRSGCRRRPRPAARPASAARSRPWSAESRSRGRRPPASPAPGCPAPSRGAASPSPPPWPSQSGARSRSLRLRWTAGSLGHRSRKSRQWSRERGGVQEGSAIHGITSESFPFSWCCVSVRVSSSTHAQNRSRSYDPAQYRKPVLLLRQFFRTSCETRPAFVSTSYSLNFRKASSFSTHSAMRIGICREAWFSA